MRENVLQSNQSLRENPQRGASLRGRDVATVGLKINGGVPAKFAPPSTAKNCAFVKKKLRALVETLQYAKNAARV